MVRLNIEGVASEVSQVLWAAKQYDPELEVLSIQDGDPAKVIALTCDDTIVSSTFGNPYLTCWVDGGPL